MRPTEEDAQKMVAQLLDLKGVCYFHPPNENNLFAGISGGKKAGLIAKEKKKGMKPGVPDILIFDPPPALECMKNGVAIELKRQKKNDNHQGNQPTDDQKEWLEKLENRGWETAVCHGYDEAEDFIEACGY